jgi:hypothetical protein
MLDNVKECEKTLLRLLKIEDSEYEILKGVPELVDTTFARAHIYFGRRHKAEKKYYLAANEFTQAIDRLDRWQSNRQMINVAIYSGILTQQEKLDLLEMLRESYYDLADIYDAIGYKKWASETREKGRAVRIK